jgi:hypothetical protein
MTNINRPLAPCELEYIVYDDVKLDDNTITLSRVRFDKYVLAMSNFKEDNEKLYVELALLKGGTNG